MEREVLALSLLCQLIAIRIYDIGCNRVVNGIRIFIAIKEDLISDAFGDQSGTNVKVS